MWLVPTLKIFEVYNILVIMIQSNKSTETDRNDYIIAYIFYICAKICTRGVNGSTQTLQPTQENEKNHKSYLGKHK